jgi:hypothetical protein
MRRVLCNFSQAKSLGLRCGVSQGQAVAGGCVNAGAQAGQQRAILIPLVACKGIQHESGALRDFECNGLITAVEKGNGPPRGGV